MNGIVIDINPTILHFGHFMLNWYGIIVILAILAAVVIAIYEGKRKGISTEVIYSLVPWMLIGDCRKSPSFVRCKKVNVKEPEYMK